MSYTLILSPKAKKFIKKLTPRDTKIIADALDGLSIDPFAGDVKRLQGVPYYRKRAGEYRIVYDVDGEEVIVNIFYIGNRKDIYKNL